MHTLGHPFTVRMHFSLQGPGIMKEAEPALGCGAAKRLALAEAPVEFPSVGALAVLLAICEKPGG